jgi:hypothetical protein
MNTEINNDSIMEEAEFYNRLENGELSTDDVRVPLFSFLFNDGTGRIYQKALDEMFTFYFKHHRALQGLAEDVTDAYNFLSNLITHRNILIKLATDKKI